MAASAPCPSTPAGGSTAAVAAETVAGSHVLTVDGYSKAKEALGVGGSIESERFSVGGHWWYIEFYPCGEDEESAGWVSVFLCLDHGGAKDEAKARSKLILLDRAGETILADSVPGKTETLTSSVASVDSWGISKLIKTTDLESLLLKDNEDAFRIRCDVAVVREPPALQPGPGHLHRHLGDLLASQPAGRDVTFEVGGELFTAHKCVLAARSSVFLADLYGQGNQGTVDASHIRIDGMEPRVFKALLHFVYTDSYPVVNEGDKVAIAQGLLAAADRYDMERLKLVCGDILCTYIDAATAVITLQLAHKHGCHKLKEACTKFLKDVLAKAGQV